MQVNYLTIPVYIVACIILGIVTFASDRMKKRAAVAVVVPFIVITGYAIAIGTDVPAAGYFAMFLCSGGKKAPFPSLPVHLRFSIYFFYHGHSGLIYCQYTRITRCLLPGYRTTLNLNINEVQRCLSYCQLQTYLVLSPARCIQMRQLLGRRTLLDLDMISICISINKSQIHLR